MARGCRLAGTASDFNCLLGRDFSPVLLCKKLSFPGDISVRLVGMLVTNVVC